jgi:hypothetical protein
MILYCILDILELFTDIFSLLYKTNWTVCNVIACGDLFDLKPISMFIIKIGLL